MKSRKTVPSDCASMCRALPRLARVIIHSEPVRALASCLAILALMLACGPTTHAQTAHYSGVVTSWGSSSSPLASNILGVAVDASGDVFYVDGSFNLHELEAVNGTIPTTPTILSWSPSTLGNNNPQGPLAIDSSGDVFFAGGPSGATGEIFEIQAVSGSIPSNPSVTSVASIPPAGQAIVQGIALDSAGNLFVSDDSNNSIVEVPAGGGSTITVATGFNQPEGLTVDSAEDVFVADTMNQAVKEIVAVNGSIPTNPTIRTLGSGFSETKGVVVDPSGDVFVASYPSGGVDTSGKVNSPWGEPDSGLTVTLGVGTLVEVVAVNGSIPSSPAILQLGSNLNGNSPNVALARSAAGNLFVATTSSVDEVEVPIANQGTINVAGSGAISLIPFTFDSAGTPSGWSVLPSQQGANPAVDFAEVPGSDTCSTSQAYSVDSTCSIAVQFAPQRPGLRTGVIQLLGSGGNVIATAQLEGIGQGPQAVFPSNTTAVNVGSGFNGPFGIAVDSAGDLFVADTDNGLLKEIQAVNGVIPASPTISNLGGVSADVLGVAVDAAGDVFYSNGANDTIHELVAVGGSIPSTPVNNKLGSGFGVAYGIAVDAAGDVYVADTTNNAVKEILAVNGVIPSSPTIITLGSGFSAPYGVAVDAAGDVFVADFGNNAVKEILAVGGAIPQNPQILTLGSGFDGPMGVAVDAAGDVFVASREVSGGVDPSGITELLAVDGVVPASPSTITYTTSLGGSSSDLAVDSAGNVFATSSSSSVTEFALATPPTITFPTPTEEGFTDTTDGALSATVANNGNASLIFPLPTKGTNPSVSAYFLWDNSSTCVKTKSSSPAAFSLAEGANCAIAIDFAPAISGKISGSVTLTDNSENAAFATQNIGLSGTATSNKAPAPTFSPIAGTYTSTQQVTILDSNSSATIYYTTNGTAPTTSSSVYSSPISVDVTTTIEAMAVVSGLNNSVVSSATFTLKLPAPIFSPAAGNYTGTQSVTISDKISGASFYYTTNGTTPVVGQAGTQLYSGPVSLTSTTTLEAIAVMTGWTNSGVASGTYSLKLPAPSFSPIAGTYTATQSVTISDKVSGASFYYTTNGTTPVVGQAGTQLYSGPVSITSTTTLEAIAVMTGWTNSGVASSMYTLKLPAPSFSPVAGTYTSTQSVTISDKISGASFYYTTNGTTPVVGQAGTQLYSGPVSITSTTTLEAIAVMTGWTNSGVASSTYTLKVAAPTFSPAAGTYNSAQTVTINDKDTNATIWYTTDGSTPIVGGGGSTQSGPAGTGITISSTTTVNAIGSQTGWTTSGEATATYTIK